MTLKALDLQVMLPRTQDVGRIQQVQQSNEQTQQQSFAAQLLKEAEIAQRSVQNLPEAREGRIREREKEKEGFDSQQESRQGTSRDGERSPEQGQEVSKSSPGQLIDLKI